MNTDNLQSEEKQPVPSERHVLKYRGVKCLNCDHPLDLSHKYCPNCSQINSTKKVAFKDLLDEFFSSMISYDSKLRKTLGAMILKPGKITSEYIAGKRVAYTNPFRFLLSLAIVYFLMLNFSSNFSKLDRFGLDQETPSNITVGFNNVNLEALDEEDKEIAAASLDTLQAVTLNQKQKDSLHLLDPGSFFKSLEGKTRFTRYSNKSEFFQYAIRKKKLYSYEQALDSLAVPDSFENKMTYSMGQSMLRVAQQPGSYINYLISKLPFFIFFFLPIFAIFVWVLYSKKKFNYMDHLVFSFHTQSMFIILLIIAFIINSIIKVELVWLFLLIFLFYLYKAMRNFYKQGRFKTIVKFLLLNTIFFTLATILASIFFAGSIFIY